LSYLGEYSNDSSSPLVIDRKERGEQGRGEFRYFTPAMSGDETGNPDSPEQDYKRCEAYNRGEWCMMGVWAEAELIVGGTVQRVKSSGLWGIESDSEPAHFRTIASEELSSLRAILAEMGCSKRALTDAFHDVESGEFVDR
jgi:hypothetical protein